MPSPGAALDREAPIVIGGLGGSGTRVVAEIVLGLGAYLGASLNAARDNLWFTLLLNRPGWFGGKPDPRAVRAALRLFDRAMLDGLSGDLSPAESTLLREVEEGIRRHRRSGRRLGVREDAIRVIAAAGAPDLGSASAWGWKEPNSHVFLEDLLRAYPRLRYVHVVRHGLDMAYSRNRNQLRNWGARFGVSSPRWRRVAARRQLDYWIRTTRRVSDLAAVHPGLLLLSFDALCAEPAASIRKLADFVGLPCTPQRADELARSVTTPDSAGRYRRRGRRGFSTRQLRAVEELGFEILPSTPRRRRWFAASPWAVPPQRPGR